MTPLGDIRYVGRRLARRPLYAGSVVVLLALAMGGGLAVFRLIDTLLLHPLDVIRPDELITFERSFVQHGASQHGLTMTWPQVAKVLTAGGLHGAVSTAPDDKLSRHVVIRLSGGVVDDAAARFVTWNFFQVLGVDRILGRGFLPTDDRPGARPVAIATHRYWQQRFGGSPNVLGQTLQVNGVITTVVGVIDGPFAGTDLASEPPALFLPIHAAPQIGHDSLAAGDLVDRGSDPSIRPAARFQVFARVPGDRRAIQSEVVALLRSDQWSVVPLTDTMLPFQSRADLVRFLRVLASAVALTLCVACVNVGSFTVKRKSGVAN